MDNSKDVKKEYFLENGAMLKRKQIEYWGERALPIRIFSAKELRRSTDGIIRNSGKWKGCIDGRSFYFRSDLGFVRLPDRMIDWIVIQANIYHRNVQRLLGCCLETRIPIPICESTSDDDYRTLSDHLRRCERHLYGDTAAEQLRWSDRIRIAAEVADALNYLHTHSSRPIIHGDVNPEKILLDDRLTAKLTGFQFSGAMPADRREEFVDLKLRFIDARRRFFDARYLSTLLVNEKVDVYSLGMVIIRLLTGIDCECIMPENFPSYPKKGRYAEIPFDRKIEQIQAFTICEGKTEQVEALCELTLKCIADERESRPTMKEVVQALRQIRNM